jgi:hypothetical protein
VYDQTACHRAVKALCNLGPRLNCGERRGDPSAVEASDNRARSPPAQILYYIWGTGKVLRRAWNPAPRTGFKGVDGTRVGGAEKAAFNGFPKKHTARRVRKN